MFIMLTGARVQTLWYTMIAQNYAGFPFLLDCDSGVAGTNNISAHDPQPNWDLQTQGAFFTGTRNL